MFRKIRDDIGSIKRTVAQILATTEYLKMQNIIKGSQSLSTNERDMVANIIGNWTIITVEVSQITGLEQGIYYVVGTTANEIMSREAISFAGLNLFVISLDDCKKEDFSKDGISLEIELGDRKLTRVSLAVERHRNIVLKSLQNNIIRSPESVGIIKF